MAFFRREEASPHFALSLRLRHCGNARHQLSSSLAPHPCPLVAGTSRSVSEVGLNHSFAPGASMARADDDAGM